MHIACLALLAEGNVLLRRVQGQVPVHIVNNDSEALAEIRASISKPEIFTAVIVVLYKPPRLPAMNAKYGSLATSVESK